MGTVALQSTTARRLETTLLTAMLTAQLMAEA